MKLVIVLLVLYVSIHAELLLKPQARSLKKNVGESLVLTCEWENDEILSEDEDYVRDDGGGDIKWFDATGNEVVSFDSSSNKFIEADPGYTTKLYLNHISRADGGDYRCERKAGSGETETQTIKLIIFQEITFIDTPLSQHPAIATDALIRCQATSYPQPVLSWQFKKRKIGTGKRPHKYKMTDEGIIIKNISKSDNGVYLCRVEVAEEAMFDEKKITVEVHEPPVMTKGLPHEMEGVEGDDMELSCAADAFPAPLFHFFNNDKEEKLESSERIKIDEVKATLVFSPLLEEDNGSYSCKAVNDVGDDISTGVLQVLVKPAVTFKNVTVVEGQPAHLDCSARAIPKANFTFLKLSHQQTHFQTGDNNNGAIAVYQKDKNSMRLTIKSTMVDHSGSYECRAVNKAGRDESVAYLSVEYKPRFSEEMHNELYIWPGKSKNITCLVSSMPLPTITWYYGGDVIGKGHDGFELFQLHDSVSLLQVSATDDNMKELLQGVKCVAENKYGSESFTINVKQATVPSAPMEVNVTETFSTGFLLSIIPPLNNGGDKIEEYEVDCEVEEKSNIVVNMASSSGDYHPVYTVVKPSVIPLNDKELRVMDLKPNTKYVMKVRGRNEVGSGKAFLVTGTTLDIRKPFPIKVIRVKARDFSNSLIKWHEPNTGGKPITKYQIYFRKDGEVWEKILIDVKKGESLEEYLLENLLPNSTYQVKLKAANELGWSNEGPIRQFQTPELSAHEARRLSHSSSTYGWAIFILLLILLLFFFFIIDLCCFYFNKCGLTYHLISKLRGGKGRLSEKERVVEDGEKECLKGKEADQIIKPNVICESIDENGERGEIA